MQKLPQGIQLETKEGVMQTIPKYSRFLRFSAALNNMGVVSRAKVARRENQIAVVATLKKGVH